MQSKWEDLLVSEFTISTEYENVILNESVDMSTLHLSNGNIHIVVEKLQKGFSAMTEHEVLIYVDSDVSSFERFVKVKDSDFQWTSMNQDLSDLIERESLIAAQEVNRRVLALDLEQASKYTMREVISPILIAAVYVMRQSVKIVCEKEIEGRIAKGPVDYVFTYDSFDIVLTEADKFKMNKGKKEVDFLVCLIWQMPPLGIIQNIAQQQACFEHTANIFVNPKAKGNARKRAYSDILGHIQEVVSFGTVSCGDEWVFTRFEHCRRGPPIVTMSRVRTLSIKNSEATIRFFQEQIMEILTIIVFMLTTQVILFPQFLFAL